MTMTQQSLQNISSSALPQFSNDDIDADGMKPGLVFQSEDLAVEAILRWGEKTFCPLTKARRKKGLAETGGKRKVVP